MVGFKQGLKSILEVAKMLCRQKPKSVSPQNLPLDCACFCETHC